MTDKTDFSSFYEANNVNWSERVLIHRNDTTGMYSIEDFLNGGDVLCGIEAAEIGDVSGLSILHLQCHFGMDTLSLARRGATVTGLDFSANAVGEARKLAAHAGLEARFVEGNLYDAPNLIEGQFDRVFVTWGAINWLPDVFRWAEIVAHFLKPGGSLYLAEGHPVAECFDQVGEEIKPAFYWRTPQSEPLSFDEEISYAGTEPIRNTRTYEWIHPISDVLNALIGAGLTIKRFTEHETLPWKLFPMMVPAGDSLFRLPDHIPVFPLSYSLDAAKPNPVA